MVVTGHCIKRLTQVITRHRSPILNNGRAELVSVFTYYAHMGYLAENGGAIRATNGNNSYGNFGRSTWY